MEAEDYGDCSVVLVFLMKQGSRFGMEKVRSTGIIAVDEAED